MKQDPRGGGKEQAQGSGEMPGGEEEESYFSRLE